MRAQVQFCVTETADGDRLGKLEVSTSKVADWLNFLVSPRQQVEIVSAQSRRGGLIIYFQGSDVLYSYLENKLSTHVEVTEPVMAGVDKLSA